MTQRERHLPTQRTAQRTARPVCGRHVGNVLNHPLRQAEHGRR